MARSLLARGPRAILVKHLNYPGKAGDTFEMLLVAADQAWHLQRPLLAFPRQPVGVGDLASGLFLSRLLLGDDLRNAFEFTGAAVHEVLLETQACGSYEQAGAGAGSDRTSTSQIRSSLTRNVGI